jgi:non-ribosomal peptide synthetase component F
MQPAAPPVAVSGTQYPHGVLSHPTRQREQLHSQLDYWQQRLAGIPALVELPTDRPRPAVQSLRSATERFALPATLAARLEALSGQEGVTLFMVLLAAFQTLLARYTGQEDIVVGTPILQPAWAEPEESGDVDANILVLRTDLAGDPTFHTLLRRVRAVVGEAYAHQDVPFEQLVEVLQPEWDRGHAPLVQVLFVLENASSRASQRAGRTVHAGEVVLDLCLSIQDGPEGLLGTVAYNCDLFEAGTITRLCGHYQTLLEGIAARPEWPISALPLLTPAEREQILVAWNRAPQLPTRRIVAFTSCLRRRWNGRPMPSRWPVSTNS